jgi:protein phosphatase
MERDVSPGMRDGSEAGAIPIPQGALVVLVGASGSGKSWWARRWFRGTEVVSSDRCRALVADDETDQGVHAQAFAVFHQIIRSRLELGRTTVADSTALTEFARAQLRETAAQAGAPVIALVFCTPLRVLVRQNRQRARKVAGEVLLRHAVRLRDLVEARVLEREGYAAVHYLSRPEQSRPIRVRERPPPR